MRQRAKVISRAAAVALMLVVAGGSNADAAETQARTSAESWYVVRPACPAPADCTASAGEANPYPPGTLHIAVQGGTETLRTYLELDLAAVPDDARLAGGTLRLPVAGSDAGSVQPEAAQLQACIVHDDLESVEGSTSVPPSYSCGASADARYEPADGDRSPAFVVDLAPFAAFADNGTIGLALIPAAEALTPPTTWHVAINGTAREGDVERVTVALDVDEQATTTPTTAMPSPPPIAADTDASPSFVASAPPAVAAPPRPPASGEVLAQVAEPVVTPAAATTARGFEQPGVFALPLVALAIAGYLAWALTRPIAVPQP